MMDDDVKCPFCGNTKLKVFAKLAGRYMNRYYRAQVRCLSCGASGPIARIPGYVDARNSVLSCEGAKSLEEMAIAKFSGRTVRNDDFFKD